MSKGKATLLPLGALALVMAMAAAAFACTTFAGQFKVTGDLGGTVTGTGLPGGATMVSILQGSTSASDGTAGSIEIETAAVGTAVDEVTSLPAGTYEINVWDGNAYSNQSVISARPPFLTLMNDCMTAGGAAENLGDVHVNSSGVIDQKNGSSAGPVVEFDNLDVGASSDSSIVGALGGGEGAVCIADQDQTYGNQVPITFV